MKELSIEEKAKRYDEVIKKAKNTIEVNQTIPDIVECVESLFPELAESEDERIRKEMIETLKNEAHEFPSSIIAEKSKSWIAWLEKQGELVENNMLLPFKEYDNLMDSINKKKKEGYEAGYKQGLIDSKSEHKIKPKFKVGYTIKKDGFNLGFTIVKIENGFYYNDVGDYFPFTDQDNWELAEQKPDDSKIINLDELVIELEETIGTSPHSRETIKDFFQRAVQKYMNCLRIANGEISRLVDENYSLKEKQSEQKSVEWSQEDLICLGYLADFVDKNGDAFYGKNKSNVVKWIRSFAKLPTHISINEIGQKPAEWNEEDEKQCQTFTNKDVDDVFLKDMSDAKKELENQDELNANEQTPVWEEDELTRNALINSLINLVEMYYSGYSDKSVKNRLLNFLKSLKDRLQPKPEWSEEDRDLIEEIISHYKHLIAIGSLDSEHYKSYIIPKLKSILSQNH